jgi:chemotaxis protein CheZ
MHEEEQTFITPERVEWARELLEAMQSGDEMGAQMVLEQFHSVRESPLFQEVGRLTREVHEALMEFSRDNRLMQIANAEMPDARERLRYVISLTDQAANRTLAAVEEVMPVADKLIQRSRKLAERLAVIAQDDASDPHLRTVIGQVNTYLESVGVDGNRLRGNLTEVMMAQEFQDLTGQLLMRVTEVLEQLEEKLVALIRISGQAAAPASPQPSTDDDRGHGPQVPGKEEGVVRNQDDVDDLLASLGF